MHFTDTITEQHTDVDLINALDEAMRVFREGSYHESRRALTAGDRLVAVLTERGITF